ncbi:hypothetical protein [Salinicoccus kekensis]|uniref:Uncharacterized protein n=1 Tax=Salinicoccus kekensis TaxID=714307 RepID=A0A285UWI9_9STAP|nr:hypothetical protein [Salinicoccus kekensis]SOC45086.1 hypothetical protein SAMN05878391_2594 [Salinicoccus kekensis]
MIEVISREKIQTVFEGEEIDYDIYIMEEKTPFSTKEVTIIVDFKKEELTGDCIAYGGFYDISIDECLSYIKEITHPIRTFDYIKNKYSSK